MQPRPGRRRHAAADPVQPEPAPALWAACGRPCRPGRHRGLRREFTPEAGAGVRRPDPAAGGGRAVSLGGELHLDERGRLLPVAPTTRTTASPTGREDPTAGHGLAPVARHPRARDRRDWPSRTTASSSCSAGCSGPVGYASRWPRVERMTPGPLTSSPSTSAPAASRRSWSTLGALGRPVASLGYEPYGLRAAPGGRVEQDVEEIFTPGSGPPLPCCSPWERLRRLTPGAGGGGQRHRPDVQRRPRGADGGAAGAQC